MGRAETILNKIKTRLKHYEIQSGEIVFTRPEENPQILELINQAEDEIKLIRNYPDSYTDEMIETDLDKYASVIFNLALYDYVKDGAEFVNEYNVNESNRAYVSRDKVIAPVKPIARY